MATGAYIVTRRVAERRLVPWCAATLTSISGVATRRNAGFARAGGGVADNNNIIIIMA